MKRLFVIIISLILLISFVSCAQRDTDIEEIQKSGKIRVGVTEYEPMNYRVDGEWTGFDSEVARLFSKELGVEVEFVEIVWADRNKLLNEYKIDCIWNGMTDSPELQPDIKVSDSYLVNAQVIVMQSDMVKNYSDSYQVRALKFAVEKGSSGAACVARDGYKNVTQVETQVKALEMVADGTADATVIDVVMANSLIGEGKKYENLAKGFTYSKETFAVGFREDSDLIKKFNEFLAEIKDNKLIELAGEYDLTIY